jgi:uncharacterized protein (TIGR03437 family)
MHQLLAISIIDSRRATALNRNVIEDSLMRRNRIVLFTAMAALAVAAAPLSAATFGAVVPITGHASDIALDEARGKLYIANFTANRIDVMSTADNTIRTSINVGAQPGSISVSTSGRYLLVTNYNNTTGGQPIGANLLTLVDLTTNTRQTFSTGDAPLGASFFSAGNNDMALVVTTTSVYTFDPVSGSLQVVNTFANLSKALPVPAVTFPGQITETALTLAADRVHIWGVGGGGTGTQILYYFDATTGRLQADGWITSPPLLPRVSVAADGSWAMIGWASFTRSLCRPATMLRSRFPGVVTSDSITGHVIDSKNNILYAQIPDINQPTGTPSGGTGPVKTPAMLIMDADNLTVRDRLNLPENMTGRAILNTALDTIYAVSDSGAMVLPVGSLARAHRLAASTEDLLVQSNFCNRNAVKQTFVISDPGGNRTDFTVTASQAGVTVSPNSGTTPATITVTVDPNGIQSTFGTLAVPIQISSVTAVNAAPKVRLLISSPDQDQRGTVINVPGTLTDILPDPARKRFYVVRQDKNQVLVFDATNNKQITALRTQTTPTRMSFTSDAKALLVAAADSELVSVFDLDALQELTPIVVPPGHYAHSIAQSNNATLILVQNDTASTTAIDRVSYPDRCAFDLPSLGVYVNDKANLPSSSVLSPTPGQNQILVAASNGNVMLYDAQADTFVISRKDISSLTGAYAAADAPGPGGSNDVGTFVVGNSILNPALVPMGTLDTSVGNTMGFAFTGQGQAGFRVTGNSASGPGVIQNLSVLGGGNVRPVRVTESPLISSTTNPFVRTVAPMPSTGSIVVLTTSGVTVLAGNYDAAVAPPAISSIVNAADGTKPVAPGGLISVFGKNMSATNVATSQMPLPTALGQSCLMVNGTLVPLLFVSTSQINAQLPSRVNGSAVLTIHTPGGVSDNFNFAVNNTAPSVFQSGSAGPQTGLATIFRADNGQLVTPTNPVRSNSVLVIYLTGMGATSPAVDDGMPAPDSPLASTIVSPNVTLGGTPLGIYYAGLVPGLVGVYQINAVVPLRVPEGVEVPLVVDQGGTSTTLSVRVVQ